MTMTSFTRIAVVLGFVRRALSTQEVPPTQVLLGLALFLTFFVMAPTWNRIHEEAIRPYFDEEISLQDGMKRAEAPIRAPLSAWEASGASGPISFRTCTPRPAAVCASPRATRSTHPSPTADPRNSSKPSSSSSTSWENPRRRGGGCFKFDVEPVAADDRIVQKQHT
ncbi:MAG: EscR/YscR/HrcR family type III secretion system export apparatus protein [Myxococcales bacterium]|nr:EscR/YscR/HrcR family type III secretion system export apparatus protein [Myxococcales bacterium]